MRSTNGAHTQDGNNKSPTRLEPAQNQEQERGLPTKLSAGAPEFVPNFHAPKNGDPPKTRRGGRRGPTATPAHPNNPVRELTRGEFYSSVVSTAVAELAAIERAHDASRLHAEEVARKNLRIVHEGFQRERLQYIEQVEANTWNVLAQKFGVLEAQPLFGTLLSQIFPMRPTRLPHQPVRPAHGPGSPRPGANCGGFSGQMATLARPVVSSPKGRPPRVAPAPPPHRRCEPRAELGVKPVGTEIPTRTPPTEEAKGVAVAEGEKKEKKKRERILNRSPEMHFTATRQPQAETPADRRGGKVLECELKEADKQEQLSEARPSLLAIEEVVEESNEPVRPGVPTYVPTVREVVDQRQRIFIRCRRVRCAAEKRTIGNAFRVWKLRAKKIVSDSRKEIVRVLWTIAVSQVSSRFICMILSLLAKHLTSDERSSQSTEEKHPMSRDPAADGGGEGEGEDASPPRVAKDAISRSFQQLVASLFVRLQAVSVSMRPIESEPRTRPTPGALGVMENDFRCWGNSPCFPARPSSSGNNKKNRGKNHKKKHKGKKGKHGKRPHGVASRETPDSSARELVDDDTSPESTPSSSPKSHHFLDCTRITDLLYAIELLGPGQEIQTELETLKEVTEHSHFALRGRLAVLLDTLDRCVQSTFSSLGRLVSHTLFSHSRLGASTPSLSELCTGGSEGGGGSEHTAWFRKKMTFSGHMYLSLEDKISHVEDTRHALNIPRFVVCTESATVAPIVESWASPDAMKMCMAKAYQRAILAAETLPTGTHPQRDRNGPTDQELAEIGTGCLSAATLMFMDVLWYIEQHEVVPPPTTLVK